MWISSHNTTVVFLKRIRAKACTKVPVVWPTSKVTSSTSSARRYLCTAYTAGFLHYQLFVSMDRSSRSQPHDATRQCVQIVYLSPDNLASFPQVSLFSQECSRKSQLKRKNSINKMTTLRQSLPEASMNRIRQRDFRTLTNSLRSQDAVMKLLVLLKSVSWEKCLLLVKQRKEADPFRNWEGRRSPVLCTIMHHTNLWQILLFTLWVPGCLR